MKPVIYVVVNKSLNMSAGKLAAQVGHAVAGVMAHRCGGRDGSPLFGLPMECWQAHPHRWMIILEAKSGEQLYYLYEYLRERDMDDGVVYRVIDEGVNEILPFSITALGIGPLDKDSEQAKYLSGLRKYTPGLGILRANNLEIDSKYLNRRGRKVQALGW